MSDAEDTIASSRRPSLQKLRIDVREQREKLEVGFAGRADVLRWFQATAVRTRGEIPQRRLHQLAAEFPPTPDHETGEFLRTLLTDADSSYDDRQVREYFWAWSVLPAYHRAIRELRKDAGEYIGDTEDGQDPADMRYIAMRPALDELDEHQRTVLDRWLDGFDRPIDVIAWGEDLQLATHGEKIQTDRGGEFATRLFTEGIATDQLETTAGALLTGESEASARARQWVAAKMLLPAFNRGVRDLAGRTGEEVDDGSDGVGEAPGWGGSV